MEHSTRGLGRENNAAWGKAECCIVLNDPAPECCIQPHSIGQRGVSTLLSGLWNADQGKSACLAASCQHHGPAVHAYT